LESIKKIYRIGRGPSSSHTMAPKRAAEKFLAKNLHAHRFRVTLFESLAATGKGHLSDLVLKETFAPAPVEIVWKPEQRLPEHPNGMLFEAFDKTGNTFDSWKVYSVGGGALREEGAQISSRPVYALSKMNDIMDHCIKGETALWQYVEQSEGAGIWDYLETVWQTMCAAIDRGLQAEGFLPGSLRLKRKASTFFRQAHELGPDFKPTAYLSAYAFAVAEGNAAGEIVVTAPTCGACGIVPAVLRYMLEAYQLADQTILQALATAGLIGNLIKTNGSISGAEVGCQGEVGSACAMAAAAAAQMLGGSVYQIEYAAEMGLEHHLGLTCDPVDGLVQIPCIERNAHAATRAHSCAQIAIMSDGVHRIPFDQVVSVMQQTGKDLPSIYRETSRGGLARFYEQSKKP
jgi:L-serine dehydratase